MTEWTLRAEGPARAGRLEVIREARRGDLPALEWGGEYTHFRRTYRHTFEEARAGRRVMLVAEVRGQIVGQIFVQLKSKEPEFADDFRRGYLFSLRVKNAYRGQGIGTRLLDAAEMRLRELGFERVSIAVTKTNPSARRMYECRGYHMFKEDPGEWSFVDHRGRRREVREPCWLLEKTL